MSDFADAAAEIVEGLGCGNAFVYFDGEALHEIEGVFSNAFQRVEGTVGPGVASRRPELSIRTDIITEPKSGDQIFRGTLTEFVGSFDYEVVSKRDDEEETVANLILKKAPA